MMQIQVGIKINNEKQRREQILCNLLRTNKRQKSQRKMKMSEIKQIIWNSKQQNAKEQRIRMSRMRQRVKQQNMVRTDSFLNKRKKIKLNQVYRVQNIKSSHVQKIFLSKLQNQKSTILQKIQRFNCLKKVQTQIQTSGLHPKLLQI